MKQENDFRASKEYKEALEKELASLMEDDNYKDFGFTERPTEEEARKVIAEHLDKMFEWYSVAQFDKTKW